MLIERFGLGAGSAALFAHLQERWDGKGDPGRVQRDEVPLAMRIAHVARDADASASSAALSSRSALCATARVERLTRRSPRALPTRPPRSWRSRTALTRGSRRWPASAAPGLTLEGGAIDRALSAMGDFADLASPYLVGHSAGVAQLASAAAQRSRFEAGDRGLATGRGRARHRSGRGPGPRVAEARTADAR